MLLNCVSVTHTSRSSHPEVLCKKWCSKNLNKIHRKTPVPESPFFNKNFIKKETLTQVFSCEFCEISKNTGRLLRYLVSTHSNSTLSLEKTSQRLNIPYRVLYKDALTNNHVRCVSSNQIIYQLNKII